MKEKCWHNHVLHYIIKFIKYKIKINYFYIFIFFIISKFGIRIILKILDKVNTLIMIVIIIKNSQFVFTFIIRKRLYNHQLFDVFQKTILYYPIFIILYFQCIKETIC